MNEKLIFIDIDGVLNNLDDGTSYMTFNPNSYGLSKNNIEVLKDILKNTGAKLVLSTSWRKHSYDYEYPYHNLLFKSPLKKFIEIMGEDSFYEHSEAPHMKGFQKYYDILGFFYKYDLDMKTTKFVVVDDQINQLLEKFGENFFLIDGQHGLTESNGKSIALYLNKDQ